jgi:hypothetical protein
MFYCGCNDVIANPATRKSDPFDRKVVRFRASTREHDPSCRAVEQLRDLPPSRFNDESGVVAGGMNAGGIAEASFGAFGHGFLDFRVQRRSRIMVKIDVSFLTRRS